MKRFVVWVSLALLLFGLTLLDRFFDVIRWSLLGIRRETVDRFFQQLGEPAFWLSIGLAFFVVFLWAVLRYIQGPK